MAANYFIFKELTMLMQIGYNCMILATVFGQSLLPSNEGKH